MKLSLKTFASCFSVSTPSFGHFNTDDILDVVVEEDIGSNKKRVSYLQSTLVFIFSTLIFWFLFHFLCVDNNPGWEVWRCAVGAQTSCQCQLSKASLSSHHQLLLGLHVLGLDATRVQLIRKDTAYTWKKQNNFYWWLWISKTAFGHLKNKFRNRHWLIDALTCYILATLKFSSSLPTPWTTL